jgi:hypothetical protein
METTFFDLPLDLRQVVYKRARFMEARQRIAELLGPGRQQRSALAPVKEHSFWHWQVEVKLFVSPTKSMLVRQSYYNGGAGPTKWHQATGYMFNTVEIVDDACIHVVIDVYREKVKLILGTRLNLASHVRINNEDTETTTFVAKSWWWHEKNLWMHLPVLEYD